MVPAAPGKFTDGVLSPAQNETVADPARVEVGAPTIAPCGLMKFGVVNVEPGGSNEVDYAILSSA